MHLHIIETQENFFKKLHTFGDGESNPGRKTTQQVELWTGRTRKKRTWATEGCFNRLSEQTINHRTKTDGKKSRGISELEDRLKKARRHAIRALRNGVFEK